MAIITLTNEDYGWFDYTDDSNKKFEYSSVEWCDAMKGIMSNGVSKNNYGGFALTQSGRQITLSTGMGFVEGRYVVSKREKTFNVPTVSSGTRTDKICLVLNVPNRTINLNYYYDYGTSKFDQWDGDVYRMVLYTISATANTINVTDNRNFTYDSVDTVREFNEQMAAHRTQTTNAINTAINGLTPAKLGAATSGHKHTPVQCGFYFGANEPTGAPAGSVWFKYVN